MGAFGQNDFGSPLGAINPGEVFDNQGIGWYGYSGWSSRDGNLGLSGFSMFSFVEDKCKKIELIPWSPTLIFPLNYETLNGKTEIIWREAVPQDSCNDYVTYEIQYTSSFSRGYGWRTIANDIPKGITKFIIDFDLIPFTDDGGIRIRARDAHGVYSIWSSSIRPFSVLNHPPNPVFLIYPSRMEIFDDILSIIWKEPEVSDIDGQVVTYSIEITSNYDSNTGWTIVPNAEYLPRGTTSFTVNTFDFQEGTNYGVRIFSIDSMGAKSTASKSKFSIVHSGNFIIDTTPPSGRILINDGSNLVTDTRVKIDLYAIDKTTGVKDIRLRNSDESNWGDWDTYVPQKFWDLSNVDGLKRVFVQFRDYAGNVSEICGCELINKVLCGNGNVTDLESGQDRLYSSFDKDGRIISYSLLPVNLPSLPLSEVTAMSFFNKDLYASAYNSSSNYTIIYKIRGTPSSFALLNGKVLCMSSFFDKLFVGINSGFIKDISGSGTQYPSEGSPSLPPITRLRTDGAILYAIAGNKYITYNGYTWQEHTI